MGLAVVLLLLVVNKKPMLNYYLYQLIDLLVMNVLMIEDDH
jgi:hypothetical protein